MATQPRYTKSLAMQRTSINSSGDPVEIWTADETNDLIIKKIMVSSDDSSAQTLELYLNDGTNDDLMGKVEIAITAGTDASKPPVDVVAELPELFSEMDNANNPSLMLPAGCALKAKLGAVTSGKVFKIWVFAEKYD